MAAVSTVFNAFDAGIGKSYEAYLLASVLQSRTLPQHESMADRAGRVAHIRLSPMKFVGYQDGGAAFSAIATDLQGQTVHGVKFTYVSSDESKLQIDETGHAKFLQPGLARVICRAGTIQATAPVLIRPGHLPIQTDAQWRLDQALLAVDGTVRGDSGLPTDDTTVASSGGSGPSILGRPSSILGSLSSMFSKLSPTVEAQSTGASDLAYDELWSEPRNLVGSPRNRVIEPMRLGSVLPEGSDFDLAIPIVSLGGRGLSANLVLYYNSRVWSRRDSRMAYDAITGWPSPGFSLGFGRLVFYGGAWIGGVYTGKYLWVEPDGTRHYLGSGAWETFGSPQTFETTDGSHIVYSGDGSQGGNLYYPDGTHLTINMVNNRLVPTMINDRNGNYIQIAYKTDVLVECCGTDCWCDVQYPPLSLDYVVDTLGRMITFDYYIDSSGNPNGLRLISGPPGFSGGPLTKLAQFYYTPLTVSGSFSGLTVERGATAWGVLSRLYFPATGTGYVFSYSGFGMISSGSLRRQMSIDSFGNLLNGVESAAVSFNYPASGTLTDAPAFTQRTETAVNAPSATFSYSVTPDTVNQTINFVITRPDGSYFWMARSSNPSSVANGLMFHSEVSGGSAVDYGYGYDGGGSPQITSVLTTLRDGTGLQTYTTLDYDQYGNVINKREYGNQINGTWQVRRRTHFAYNTDSAYISAQLRSLVTEVGVYDGGLDTNDSNDLLIAKSTYAYDNYGAMGGMETYSGSANPPGHISWYNSGLTTRGNVTGITQWIDIAAGPVIQHLAKYDIFGNVVKAQVSCCQERDLTMTGNTYWSETENVTSGDPNGIHQTTSTDYDFNTSLPTSSTDAGGLTTTYGYDAALNPTSATLPTGATESATYNYGNLSKTSTVSYTDTDQWGNSITKTINTSEQCDGWGRVIQSIDRNGGQVNTTYNAMGRVASRTNPFTAGGTPGPATTFQYDVLGRVTVTTLPDGNTVQNTYSGSTVIATDQVGRQIKREVDGLGRLIKVTEQDVSTGLLTQETTYSYNLLDKLTGLNQGGQLRSYKYDAMGRLLYERIPEQNATINDETGTMWSCKYTYTEFGGVATKQDARRVVTTFTYDALHHVTQKTYDTTGAPGVAATSPVTFGYTSWGALLSVTAGAYNEYTAFDVYNRPNSVTGTIDGRDYTTSYNYNGASQVTWMAYPSGYVTGVSYDDRGRLRSEGAYLSEMSYNIAGQVTGLTLGNGVVESYSYDTNRMQLTTQTATKSGNQLMNLSYSYSTASAGRFGTNTTAGNPGQLLSMSGTINATSESAAYAYDDLGRLVTSNQTSNSASAQRRFDYDRWGNRTAVWDATSGGNQIQSVALEQSGGAPTNRIQSVSGVARTNVALAANGATATASSSFSGAYPASAVINGDRRGVNWGNGGGWNDANPDFPDWLQVSFNGSKTINEIDVFTLQDNYSNPSEPTESMTFSQFGITDFQVQYWNGSWQTVPGGSVAGNNKVWRKFTFSNITTDKIRVYITGALASYSRLTEIEAYSNTNNCIYDAAGNITNDGVHSYTYDAENRLVSIDGGVTGSYTYDHQNRRIKKTIGSTVTHYVWQGSHVIAEHDGNTPVGGSCDRPYGERSSLVDYVYLGSRLISSRQYMHNCGTTWQWCDYVGYVQQAVTCSTDRYYLSDRLSTRVVLDGIGNVIGRQGHLPFGEDFAESGTQEKHHFTSYERDGESGTDYALNRQSQFVPGRFDQVDKASAQLGLPQSLNRYSYGRNDPINTLDPLGLFIFDCPSDRLLPWGVTFLLDGIELPRLCFTIVLPIIIIPWEPSEPKPHPFPGFSDSKLGVISKAKDGAYALLHSNNCLANLGATKAKSGKSINATALEEALANTFVKPLKDATGRKTDPSIHDSIFGHEYNVFDGSASSSDYLKGLKGNDVGAVDLDGIFLFDEFFGPATNPSARIGLDQTRAIAFLHEVIHTLRFDDDDYGTDKKWGLQDFIIKSCVNKNYDHNDTSF